MRSGREGHGHGQREGEGDIEEGEGDIANCHGRLGGRRGHCKLPRQTGQTGGLEPGGRLGVSLWFLFGLFRF